MVTKCTVSHDCSKNVFKGRKLNIFYYILGMSCYRQLMRWKHWSFSSCIWVQTASYPSNHFSVPWLKCLTRWSLGDLAIGIQNISLGTRNDIALMRLPMNLTNKTSVLFQVMVWGRHATIHYLGQCWPRSMSSQGVTRQQYQTPFKLGDTQMHKWIGPSMFQIIAWCLFGDKILPEPIMTHYQLGHYEQISMKFRSKY